MARGTGNITVLAITAVLLSAAIYEGGLGVFQLLGMEPSGNRLYPFTGTFYNPGPFACYLALSLPWALRLISNEQLVIPKTISNEQLVISNLWDPVHNKLNWKLLITNYKLLIVRVLITNCALIEAWIVVGLDAVLLPASMSRTAWCAAVAGGIVALLGNKVILFGSRLKDVCTKNSLLPHRPSPLILHSSPSPHRPSPLTLHSSLLIIIIAICSLLIVGVYRMKQGSADGRFLMWKVAAGAVDPHPFEGVGWQNVAGAYGMAQERYFASGTASPGEILVADAPEYVFNEYLQIAIAYGWGWSLLMIAILIGAFVSAFHNGRYGIAGSVAACAVVMTASYPFQFPISILTIGAICIAAFIGAGKVSERKFKIQNSTFKIIPVLAATIFLTIDCKKFDQNVLFQTGLALHKSGQWEKSNEVMMDLLPHSSDPMPLNIIGKNYTELNIRDSAEHYLHRSTLRCPNRLYPHYLLMKLYLKEPTDSAAARREAKILLTKKEKVPSPAIEEMRKEAERLIHNS